MYNWGAMSEFEANGSVFDWECDDFMDVAEPIVEEDDPWGATSDEDRFADEHYTPGNQEVEALEAQSGKGAKQRLGSDYSLSDRTFDAEAMRDREQLEPTLRDGLTDDDIWLLDARDGELGFDDGYFSEVELEEPEPVAEYDNDLGETLYESTGTGEVLARNLKIDEFVAYIGDANSDQRSQCAELLSELRPARLRYWLTWLHRQVWTGSSLLLLLEFRIRYWEENEEWWELNVWREWTGHWWAYSNSGTLSLDATYELVQLRVIYPAEQVIDGSWLVDWNVHTPWRLGVSSFAEYVLFRAGLKRGEDWIEILRSSSQPDIDSSPDEDSHVENASRSDAEFWFAIQDWHDSADWHDNLGWASGWIEATHPYLPDASWQQYEST